MILNQMGFRLVPNQSENGEWNLISIDSTKFRTSFIITLELDWTKITSVARKANVSRHNGGSIKGPPETPQLSVVIYEEISRLTV